MTPRREDLIERKERILSIAIEHYIKTVSPVSSGYIAKRYPSDLSSATVRNILAELEQDGFLTHPHTSAGRVPTQEGYRYYVDNLMLDINLLEVEKRKIKEEYERETKELESLLEKTTEVISDFTHYTSIISVDGWDGKLFCRGTSLVVNYPDQQDIQKIKSILFALDEKERLLAVINQDLAKKIEVYIGQEIEYKQISNCSLVVSSYKTSRGPSGRIAVLGPTRMNYERVISALDYFTELLPELL